MLRPFFSVGLQNYIRDKVLPASVDTQIRLISALDTHFIAEGLTKPDPKSLSATKARIEGGMTAKFEERIKKMDASITALEEIASGKDPEINKAAIGKGLSLLLFCLKMLEPRQEAQDFGKRLAAMLSGKNPDLPSEEHWSKEVAQKIKETAKTLDITVSAEIGKGE